MSVKTSRAEGPAIVTIDYDNCTACGLCVRVCKGGPLYLADGRVQVDQARYWGCIGCGHCAAICPSDGIRVEGRDISPADTLPLPPPAQRATYDQMQGLLLARRSMRAFREAEVPAGTIDQILAAASTAPMGVPPTDVSVVVLAGRDRVRAFRDDTLKVLAGWNRWMGNPIILKLLRPFFSRTDYEAFRDFIGPAIGAYLEKDQKGIDWFFYDAPLALLFYGSAFSDPGDPVIAATYAMLAGEALGLGTCMLGFPGYALKYDRGLRERWGLPGRIQPGMTVIFGYPGLHFRHAIRRRFAAVEYR